MVRRVRVELGGVLLLVARVEHGARQRLAPHRAILQLEPLELQRLCLVPLLQLGQTLLERRRRALRGGALGHAARLLPHLGARRLELACQQPRQRARRLVRLARRRQRGHALGHLVAQALQLLAHGHLVLVDARALPLLLQELDLAAQQQDLRGGAREREPRAGGAVGRGRGRLVGVAAAGNHRVARGALLLELRRERAHVVHEARVVLAQLRA